jgi:hypothetical protein
LTTTPEESTAIDQENFLRLLANRLKKITETMRVTAMTMAPIMSPLIIAVPRTNAHTIRRTRLTVLAGIIFLKVIIAHPVA